MTALIARALFLLIPFALVYGPASRAITARTVRRAKSPPTTLTFTSTQNWTVPANWPNGNNSVECIGAGGGGGQNSGGGGGAYSKTLNVALVPGSTARFVIGAGGGSGVNGGNSYFCNATTNCGSIAGTAVRTGARGGLAPSGTWINGGPTDNAVGTIKYSGGTGVYGDDDGATVGYGGGGGGAAGPAGAGGFGGLGVLATFGGGGGGNGGGRPGQVGTASIGGAGGGTTANVGGGAGGAGDGMSGTMGGGGSGARDGNGGAGSNGSDLTGSVGSGGGGGGAGGATVGYAGGAGGLYGGGGGGQPFNGPGGTGGGGVCVVKYGGDVGESGGTISWVNSFEALTLSSTTTTFGTGTWTSPPSAGNLLVCWIEYNGGSGVTVTGVTDTKGNLYRRAAPRFASASLFGGDYGDEFWYATNVSGGASFAVNATWSSNASSTKGISCHEYKGLKPLALHDQTASAQGSNASLLTGTMNLSGTPSLVILAGATDSTTVVYASPGFAKRSDLNGSFYVDGIRDGAGTYAVPGIVRPAGGYQGVAVTFVSR